MKPLALLTFLMAAMVATNVNADTSKKVLLIFGGKYFLIDVSSGTPQIGELTNVVTLDGTVPPPPPAGTRQKVKALTDTVGDPLVARAVAQGVYGNDTIQGQLNDGRITWQQALGIIKSATDLAVAQSDKPDEWATWRKGLGKIIADLTREGKLSSAADQVTFLNDVEAGMNMSVGNAAVDFEKLLELITRIIGLILSLINTGDGNAAVNLEQPTLFCDLHPYSPQEAFRSAA